MWTIQGRAEQGTAASPALEPYGITVPLIGTRECGRKCGCGPIRADNTDDVAATIISGVVFCEVRAPPVPRKGVSMTDSTTFRNSPRVRRAVLTVPGGKPGMLDKAVGLAVDQVVLDLEDSVVPTDKANARSYVVDVLSRSDWRAVTRSVRINGCRTPWAHRDLSEVVQGAGSHLHTIVIPKVEDPAEVHFVDLLLTQLELEHDLPVHRIGIELLIESPQGLVALLDLLDTSRRIESVILGPGDLAAAMGWPAATIGSISSTYPGDNWHWIRSQIVVHTRARNLQAIDGPFVGLGDPCELVRTARVARTMGFDGKWVIHPQQVEPVAAEFGVSLEEFERAHDMTAALQFAARIGAGGAVTFDGEMIDEASRRMAEVTVARGQAMGLQVRPTPEEVPWDQRGDWRVEHGAKP